MKLDLFQQFCGTMKRALMGKYQKQTLLKLNVLIAVRISSFIADTNVGH
jgi:hypothetical protein